MFMKALKTLFVSYVKHLLLRIGVFKNTSLKSMKESNSNVNLVKKLSTVKQSWKNTLILFTKDLKTIHVILVVILLLPF